MTLNSLKDFLEREQKGLYEKFLQYGKEHTTGFERDFEKSFLAQPELAFFKWIDYERVDEGYQFWDEISSKWNERLTPYYISFNARTEYKPKYNIKVWKYGEKKLQMVGILEIPDAQLISDEDLCLEVREKMKAYIYDYAYSLRIL
jgi:hypothetical protein